MYYPRSKQLEIGRRVFTHEITKEAAAREYGTSQDGIVECVKEYMRSEKIKPVPEASCPPEPAPDYSAMSKDELITVIMKKEIEVARAKKGYSVKGGGRTKEFSSIKG